MSGIQDWLNGTKRITSPITETNPVPSPVITPDVNRQPLAWERYKLGSAAWSDQLRALVRASTLPDSNPKDVTVFAATYPVLSREMRVEFWSQFISIITKFESSFDPSVNCQDVGTVQEKDTWSVGLLQLSVCDQPNYGIKLKYNFQDLQNPIKNLTLGVAIMAMLINRDKVLCAQSGDHWLGLTEYWSTLRSTLPASKMIQAYMNALILSSSPKTNQDAQDSTPWVTFFKEHDGESCPTGAPPTAFIEMIFKHTDYGPLNGITPPACAAGMCAALETNGYKSTHDASAISYKDYGTECEMKFGAILVLQHASGGHHVTTFDSWKDKGNFVALCRGSNQDHKVQLEAFDLSGNVNGHNSVIACRWPVK